MSLADYNLADYNPFHLNRYHLRLMDEVDQVKNILHRLEYSVKVIKIAIQPLYSSYPICTIKDAENTIKLVKKRIGEYSTNDYMNNISRMIWPLYVLDDIARDLRIISFGLQALMVDLQVFQIFLSNRVHMTKEQNKTLLKDIDRQCQQRTKDVKDTEFKDVLKSIQSTMKKTARNTIHIPSRLRRSYAKGKGKTTSRDIRKTLKNRKPDVVEMRESGMNVFETSPIFPGIQPPVTYASNYLSRPGSSSSSRNSTKKKKRRSRRSTKSKSKTKSK